MACMCALPPTSSTMSTAPSCSRSAFSALAMCPGYHCTMLTACSATKAEAGPLGVGQPGRSVQRALHYGWPLLSHLNAAAQVTC